MFGFGAGRTAAATWNAVRAKFVPLEKDCLTAISLLAFVHLRFFEDMDNLEVTFPSVRVVRGRQVFLHHAMASFMVVSGYAFAFVGLCFLNPFCSSVCGNGFRCFSVFVSCCSSIFVFSFVPVSMALCRYSFSAVVGLWHCACLCACFSICLRGCLATAKKDMCNIVLGEFIVVVHQWFGQVVPYVIVAARRGPHCVTRAQLMRYIQQHG